MTLISSWVAEKVHFASALSIKQGVCAATGHCPLVTTPKHVQQVRNLMSWLTLIIGDAYGSRGGGVVGGGGGSK